MKLHIGIAIILSQLTELTVHAFAPSSSFTTFQVKTRGFHHGCSSNHRAEHAFSQMQKSYSSSRRYNGNNTGMKMMFDQLSTAINDIAKNIGGRQRSVCVFPFCGCLFVCCSSCTYTQMHSRTLSLIFKIQKE